MKVITITSEKATRSNLYCNVVLNTDANKNQDKSASYKSSSSTTNYKAVKLILKEKFTVQIEEEMLI